jgi:putative ABC transport system permease protein
MLSVYTTLSVRYLRRRWFYALLIVTSIAAGVSLLVATRAINETMDRAAQATATPVSGAVDLMLCNAEAPIDQALVDELRIPGIKCAFPRIFENVHLPDLGNRDVLLLGIDTISEQNNAVATPWPVEFSKGIEGKYALEVFTGGKAVVVGKALQNDIGNEKKLRVQSDRKRESTKLAPVGTVDARGPAASLGGSVLIVDLKLAREILGLAKGKVSRIDISLVPSANVDEVRKKIAEIVAGRADIRTPQEQNKAVQNVLSGVQIAMLLCGIAALVVGLFLVYNTLSVSVAERRHEIGVLLSVGATRGQIRSLFAWEAAILGLAGSLLGIPLGIAFASLALEPVRGILQEIFFNINATGVHVDFWLIAGALAAGVVTAVLAALIPAIQASRETPAEAVRRMPRQSTWNYRLTQIIASAAMLTTGLLLVTARDYLPLRIGMYAGLALMVVAALLATPLFTALAARALQPLIRACFGLESRLAADNLIRSPGRTGIVIAALAAGVALFLQTAGAIQSNRVAIREWVEDSVAADMCVTAGSPVGAGGGSKPMDLALGADMETIPGVECVIGARIRKPYFRDTQILMIVLDAAQYYDMHSKRDIRLTGLGLFKTMSETPNTVIVSNNFAARHGVRTGDTIALKSPNGPVDLKVIGQLTDYSWNHGTIFVNRKDHDRLWGDPRVDVYDVYLNQDKEKWAVAASFCKTFGWSDAAADEWIESLKLQRKQQVQETILKKHGAQLGLFVLTREELHHHIDGMIERLYGIAYGQQFVVLFVAALGVVTALLISVLQRRREIGLLRAIGASRTHIIRCVLAEALLMGFIGSAIGLIVGIPLEWFALQVVILEETGYLFPVIVPWRDALLIAASAILVAALAGVGPALFAVRQRIPEAIAVD